LPSTTTCRLDPLPERTQDASGQTLITWKLAEDQGLPISQTSLSGLAEAALSMTYSEVIVDDPDDLAAFGLTDRPARSRSFFSNGSSKTVEFGSSLSSGQGVYTRISQDTRIYAGTAGSRTRPASLSWTWSTSARPLAAWQRLT
jgi:hypothetical protein